MRGFSLLQPALHIVASDRARNKERIVCHEKLSLAQAHSLRLWVRQKRDSQPGDPASATRSPSRMRVRGHPVGGTGLNRRLAYRSEPAGAIFFRTATCSAAFAASPVAVYTEASHACTSGEPGMKVFARAIQASAASV